MLLNKVNKIQLNPAKLPERLIGTFEISHGLIINEVIMSPDESTIVSYGTDKTVKAWKMPEGTQVGLFSKRELFPVYKKIVTSAIFSPDNKYLLVAFGSGSMSSVSIIERGSGEKDYFIGQQKETYRLAYSADSKYLATSGLDKMITIWKMPEKEAVVSINAHKKRVLEIAFSPNGKYLASTSKDGTLKLWEMPEGKLVTTFYSSSNKVFSQIAFSPNNSLLVASDNNIIKVWKIPIGEEVATLKGHSKVVSSFAFRSDSKYLASGGSDKTIKLWEIQSGKEVGALEEHKGMVNKLFFYQDDKLLILASYPRREINIWGPEIST